MACTRQGSPKYPGDRQRSIPLEQFAPLAQLPGVELVSLQKGFGSEQLHALADRVEYGGAHLILVELDQHPAVRVHALADLVAQVALDQRLVAAEEKIVGFRAIDPADLVD